MSTIHYPAIIEAADTEGFGVYFPDLPGCTSAGSTVDEAAIEAATALALHVHGMLEDGEDLPLPSSLTDLKADPESDEACRILVRVDLPGKTVRFNASMDESLLARIDAAATAQGISRSGFLAEAARRLLG